ncbi:MAG: MscL family protein [Candidatus Micrarchaeia archaeon]
MSLISEFKDFLNEYKFMGLAVAFIIGGAITILVQSLVNNIIMSIFDVLLPNVEGKLQNLHLLQYK